MSIVSMSLIASIPILIIIILRAIGLNKLPKKIFVILWGIVLCRLLIPFTIQTNLTIDQTVMPLSRSPESSNSIQQTINQLASPNQVADEGVTSSGVFASISPILIIWLIVAVLILDRKSTRLNSSHVAISYAVFCLKKKTKSVKHLDDLA